MYSLSKLVIQKCYRPGDRRVPSNNDLELDWGNISRNYVIKPDHFKEGDKWPASYHVTYDRRAAAFNLSVSSSTVDKGLEKLLKTMTEYLKNSTRTNESNLKTALNYKNYCPKIPLIHVPDGCFVGAPLSTYFRKAEFECMGINYEMRKSAHELLDLIESGALNDPRIPQNIKDEITAVICKNAHLFMPISSEKALTQKFVKCILEGKFSNLTYVEYLSGPSGSWHADTRIFTGIIARYFDRISKSTSSDLGAPKQNIAEKQQPSTLVHVMLYEFSRYLDEGCFPTNVGISANNLSSSEAFVDFIKQHVTGSSIRDNSHTGTLGVDIYVQEEKDNRI